ncbi:alkane 1-monooxygenase [Jatrophihabitans endophyticus]|uniref:Alkane 1-monooxygenase n=1 Tax=Jatrophihabitans endophyticus TaxID=1206085 RepID=A0A1M5MUP6_9ACTN|nr:alkane 1-monooxygenase [Jatrophihabitans endophyticus]SHG80619.1 alkane 1-monooxygenase [Jatrophihabitans endophyticus]
MRLSMSSRQLAAAATDRPRWRDRKRYLWLLGTVVPLFLFAGWGLVELTGLGLFWWIGPMVVHALIPLLDVVIGDDRNNAPEEALAWLEQDRYYRWVTYLFLPCQFVAFFTGFWLMTRGDGMTVIDRLGVMTTLGLLNGIAINTAHELGHKKEHLERWFARIALAPSGYGHFFIEHNRGHHVRVATADDPASSRLGESFWRFWPRTVRGSVVNGWRLERTRLRRLDTGVWTLRNDVLNAWAMTLVLWAVTIALFGVGVLPYLLGQAVLAFSLLEAVNYLEHYGLLRETTERGRPERVTPRHSWNSNHLTTNLFLYHLQRHSDHHANPTRRYQSLRHFDESPQLPAGYAAMILLAYVPPLWRRVMDPRVLAHYDGDVTRANIDPARREVVLARYGRPGTRTSAAA